MDLKNLILPKIDIHDVHVSKKVFETASTLALLPKILMTIQTLQMISETKTNY